VTRFEKHQTVKKKKKKRRSTVIEGKYRSDTFTGPQTQISNILIDKVYHASVTNFIC